MMIDPAAEFTEAMAGRQFATILADPPWRFTNRTGKMAPEHRRLSRYGTLSLDAICALPVAEAAASPAHLYLWVPNALLPDGLAVMQAWGFDYKSNLVWHKIRKDGGSDGRGVGFYFRNVTELLLFGTRGKNARTLKPGRRQVNLLPARKREHSRKPDEYYQLIEACSPGPRDWKSSPAAADRAGCHGVTRPSNMRSTGKPTDIIPSGRTRGWLRPPNSASVTRFRPRRSVASIGLAGRPGWSPARN